MFHWILFLFAHYLVLVRFNTLGSKKEKCSKMVRGEN